MEGWLHTFAHAVALLVEAIAILLVLVGSLETVFRLVRHGFAYGGSGARRREIWLDFARWLVAALTFQLAADIVSTSFSPTWDEVGRLAVVAAIRTFLSFFLDREVENTRRLQRPET